MEITVESSVGLMGAALVAATVPAFGPLRQHLARSEAHDRYIVAQIYALRWAEGLPKGQAARRWERIRRQSWSIEPAALPPDADDLAQERAIEAARGIF